MTDDEARRSFTLEAYKCMRAEVIAQGAKYDQLKIWLLAGIGAYYAWLFSTFFGSSGRIGCSELHGLLLATILFIPIGICLMATISAGFLASYFDSVASWFLRVEKAIGIPELSWQQNHSQNKTESEKWQGFQALSDPFWSILILALVAMSGVIASVSLNSSICSKQLTEGQSATTK